ncbi:MAG: hypothetical protein E6J53_02035 [Chloroflexi bacterium]|nr:MAG: hypothetical protein E6J53_02035 [Chloroflexota bacterium]
MEVSLLLQFSIALFTGMVAATFVPPVRRVIPRAVEVLLWIAFLFVCVVGVIGVTDPNARELTNSAVWGVERLINTAAGLLFGWVGAWIYDNRLMIATATGIVAAIDYFALALYRSLRRPRGWQPRVRLREWMEMPPARPAVPQPAAAPRGVNRRLVAGVALAGASLLTGAIDFTIWMRDVTMHRQAERLARAAQASRVQSRAGLDSLRDSAAHLQFAARAWYAAAGAPAVSRIAVKANDALRIAAGGGHRAGWTSGELVDIEALLSAQSIGWYGPLSIAPSIPANGEQDGAESERTDRLAS